MNAVVNVIHWQGAGWYAPAMVGSELHEYRVANPDADWREANENAKYQSLGSVGLVTEKPDADATRIVIDETPTVKQHRFNFVSDNQERKYDHLVKICKAPLAWIEENIEYYDITRYDVGALAKQMEKDFADSQT